MEHSMVEARFWERVDGRIHCYLCARHCKIPEEGIGFCGVRKVIDGRLYALNYGRLIAMHMDPIEKKPLSHFMPGTSVLSIATVGCNFACQYCQNWDISQRRKVVGSYSSPEDVIENAIMYNADGLSYTYNEPTIFAEYAIDIMESAHKKNLFNTWVTNGFMTPEALEEIGKYLDAATVDFKGHGNREFYRKYIYVKDSTPIFDALLVMKEMGVFIEITDLVVPVKNGYLREDLRRLARWVVDNLGPETPFHLLRFHPDYRMLDVPHTPVDVLEEGVEIAKGEGLQYVYIGNVWGHRYEDTYCPECNYKVVDREGFYIKSFEITEDSRCPRCGYKLNFILSWSAG
jgi:pyruvate formate lyase activating enzyme